MDFNSSLMKLPKSSSALPSELQREVCMRSSMPSNNKIHQDEDERDPRFTQLLKENLFCFWKRQKEEILHSGPKRKHELPISRIRQAMKSNDQVKMVSAHCTFLFSKAIEMFIHELTLRAWMQADQVKRRTLNRHDFARAIRDEELFDFLSDIVPLQIYKVEKANDGQGNEFYAAYQMIPPTNIPFQVEEANDVQGNKFHLANQMVQLQNIPLYQYQVGAEANDGQGNEFDPACQIVQPNDILCQFQGQKRGNEGQGNEFQAQELDILSEALINGFDLPAYQMVQSNNIPDLPAYQMVQPNNIPVEGDADDGKENEFHPAYHMVQPDNIPCQFQVQKKANDGQGNEFQARELKILSEALIKGFDFPAYQMVQPNNIPDLPAYQMVQPNDIPCQYQMQEANDGQGNELHPTYQLVQPYNIPVEADDGKDNEFHPAYHMVQPDNIPFQFQVQKKENDGQGNEFQARELKTLSEALIKGFDFQAYQMVQPNNIPDLPAYQMVQPNNIPCQYQVQEANDGQGNELHPAYQLVQPNNIPNQFKVEEEANGGQGNEFLPDYHSSNIPASFMSIEGKPPQITLSPEDESIIDGFLMEYFREGL